MPPLTRNNGQRELEVMIANPARTAHAVATGQQGGFSGQIPGTSSDPTQVAIQYSTIQSYPNGTSPDGDQLAGVGHAALNNAGNPVVAMGNLFAPASSNHGAFQDGAFVFIDADGNHPAGYSQETGLWGFGGAEATEVGAWLFDFETVPINETMTLYYRGTFPGDTTGAGWPSDSFTWDDTVQVGPFTFPADGTIFANPYFQADIPAPTDNALNAFGLGITISSLDGSQTGVLIPVDDTNLIPTGDTTGFIDTFTFEAGEGGDIAWDGSTLTTTAGGVFWFILQLNLEFGD